MPLNRYTCSEGHEWQHIGPYKERACPECQALTKPGLPKDVSSVASFETVDPGHNVKWREGQKENAEKRNKFYNKHKAKENARVHGDSYKQHGITEDDAKMV